MYVILNVIPYRIYVLVYDSTPYPKVSLLTLLRSVAAVCKWCSRNITTLNLMQYLWLLRCVETLKSSL
uniref:Uncharacterized protein n=1 Tax=Lepeophtheirus salmonis TaxID=72036 RepID=A0A0K2VI64_LEPSM